MDLCEAALACVPAEGVVGLGTGSTAERFLRALAERVRGGLRIRGVATSRRTEALARALGIPLRAPEEVETIDLAVDGADEIDPRLNLIKGYGGALVREKIVAAAARRRLILADRRKLVPVLGARGRLPVELVPFGAAFVSRRLRAAGWRGRLREEGGRPYTSDNGNVILDLEVPPIADPEGLEAELRATPGVVATGLFLGLADEALIEGDGTLERRRRA